MKTKTIIAIFLVVSLCTGCVALGPDLGSAPDIEQTSDQELTPDTEQLPDQESTQEAKPDYVIGLCSTRHWDACPKSEWNAYEGLTYLDGKQAPNGQAYKVIDIESILMGINIEKTFSDLYPMDEDGIANVLNCDRYLTAEAQIVQAGLLIEQGIDILVVDLYDESSANETARIADEAGVPCIIFSRKSVELDVSGYDNACVVGFDRKQPVKYMIEAILDMPDHGDKDGDSVVKYVMLSWPGFEEAENTLRKMIDDSGVKTDCVYYADGQVDGMNGNEYADYIGELILERGDVDLVIDFTRTYEEYLFQNPDSAVDSYVIITDTFHDADMLKLVPAGSCILRYNMRGAVAALKSAVDQFNSGKGNPGVILVNYLKITIDNISDYDDSSHQGILF